MKHLNCINILLLILQFSAIAQVEIKKFISGDIFEIRELGVMITEENNKLIVDMIIPKENRSKDYQDVDIQKGDEIRMINGKKMKSAADCKKLYDNLAIGSEFKMAINRNGAIFITGFNKADPKTLPVMKRIVINDAGKPGLLPLPALGILLKEQNNKVIVDDVWDNAGSVLKKEIKKGDIVTKLNGQEIKNTELFSNKYDKIKVGSDLNMEFQRNGETISVNIKRPEPVGKVIIKNK
jgi:C-terminal processing protease CtpA/Prc